MACVQNQLNLVNRASMPLLDEGTAWGGRLRAVFPFSGFARHNPVVGIEDVISNAKRLGITPVQVALARTLGLAPNIMLIPGPSSERHWRRTSRLPTPSSTTRRCGS